MNKPTHCPYCITGGFGFERMLRSAAGEYACPKCGHISHPTNPYVRCECERCQVVSRLAGSRNAVSKTIGE